MSSRRLVKAVQVATVIVTIVAAAVLLLTGHVGFAVGVALAGAVLVTVVSVVGHKMVTSSDGHLSVSERRKNLAVALKFGHAFLAVGVVALVAGGVIALAGAADDSVSQVLLIWVGPFALVAALGVYTAHSAVSKDLTSSTPAE